jgi:transcriptional regulator with XRE-family HTH domain
MATISMTTLESRISSTLRETRLSAGLSLRELARRARTSHATLLAYEQSKKMPATTTFFRILEACGNVVDLDIQPRVRERDGIARGDELAAVLELADQFPVRAERRLSLPRFGHRG